LKCAMEDDVADTHVSAAGAQSAHDRSSLGHA